MVNEECKMQNENEQSTISNQQWSMAVMQEE